MTDLPKTRAEAITKRSPKYFTGTPCKHGHLSPRYTVTMVCLGCQAMRARNARQRTRLVALEGAATGLPRTRAEAQAARSSKYFTGTPCKRGHLAPRYVDNSVCMRCRAEDVRARRQACAPAKPSPQLRKVVVPATVADIEAVDAFNEGRLRARYSDNPGKRIGPMPRLLPKARIRLFTHPDDAPAVVAYADQLRTAK